ncbi:MAG: hypothetical protein JWQ42_950 [Edaphobacter sp.]|jgi:hypothetical protein|nr:hypothetical protein [Edaphobacter sp.]
MRPIPATETRIGGTGVKISEYLAGAPSSVRTLPNFSIKLLTTKNEVTFAAIA